MGIATENESIFNVDADLVVEACIQHFAINCESGVTLTEFYSLEMALKGLLHHVAQRLILLQSIPIEFILI
jgi:hypothetical protein